MDLTRNSKFTDFFRRTNRYANDKYTKMLTSEIDPLRMTNWFDELLANSSIEFTSGTLYDTDR